ncbi:hypothetical protein GJAV_G00145430 [Gymnothorax javanicus]|nr:hypothetical protein GJAV_G00145430 [Gymnothorax javanicus]
MMEAGSMAAYSGSQKPVDSATSAIKYDCTHIELSFPSSLLSVVLFEAEVLSEASLIVTGESSGILSLGLFWPHGYLHDLYGDLAA